MRRARKRLVALAVVLCALAGARGAHAFHAGSLFQKAAGAGGGGGIFYAGVPSERAWTCSGCHVDAPGKIRVTLDAEPRSLVTDFRYAPGATYTLTATMLGEHLGHDAPQANFNAVTIAIVDAHGAPVGSIDAPPDDFVTSGAATIANAGQKPGQMKWTFRWTAPDAGGGSVRIHVAAVDGNGAGQLGGGTLTDPWGDDVFTGALDLDEARGASAANARRSIDPFALAPAGGLAATLFFGMRRRRERAATRKEGT